MSSWVIIQCFVCKAVDSGPGGQEEKATCFAGGKHTWDLTKLCADS